MQICREGNPKLRGEESGKLWCGKRHGGDISNAHGPMKKEKAKITWLEPGANVLQMSDPL